VNPGTLVIRADASVAMGTGHVMRCLALAQAWQDLGGAVLFAMVAPFPRIERLLRSHAMRIYTIQASAGGAEDAKEIASVCRREGAQWIVVDGYHFDAEYQQELKNAALKLLLIDDHGLAGPYVADLVLNQNVYASDTSYQNRDKGTRLLLGSSYALLRREFRSWGECQRPIVPVAHNLLVTIGGSDPHNVTGTVLGALQSLNVPGISITAVAGGSNPHMKGLRAAVSGLGNVRLQTDVTNMPELIAWADLAITAGGGTCYELALMRTPMLLITMAENHAATCRTLEQLGAVAHVGWFHAISAARLTNSITDLMLDTERRRRMTANAGRLVDGCGAFRTVETMLPPTGRISSYACSA
jgi:UDP-2,4-diacetamido-2,4,6-trideoxy-beta-L-altropyranose hydrolase